MKIRKNTTISEAILERAEKLMALRGYDDYSEFISALVREEWERRHPPVLQPLSHGHRKKPESKTYPENETQIKVEEAKASYGSKKGQKEPPLSNS